MENQEKKAIAKMDAEKYWKKTKDINFLIEMWIENPEAFLGTMGNLFAKSQDRQKYLYPALAKAIEKDPALLDRLDKRVYGSSSTLAHIRDNFEDYTGSAPDHDLDNLLEMTIEQRKLEEIAAEKKYRTKSATVKVTTVKKAPERRVESPKYVTADGRITTGRTPDSVRRLN